MTDGDRELDAMLAERLFGFEKRYFQAISPTYGPEWRLVPPTELARVGRWETQPNEFGHPGYGYRRPEANTPRAEDWLREVPHYSSDPAACAQVKARLREAGVGFRIEPTLFADQGSIQVLHLVRNPVGGWTPGPIAKAADTEEVATALFAKALIESGVKL